MSDKQIVYNLSEKEHDLLESIFFSDLGSTSDNYSSNIAIRELINLINITLPELKIFTENEVENLISIVRNWQMDFSQFLVKQLALHKLITHNGSILGSLINKIESLSEFQCYIVLRWIKKLTNQPVFDFNLIKAYFCKYPD